MPANLSASYAGDALGGELNDITIKQALTVPSILTVTALVLAASIGHVTGVNGSLVFLPYIGAWSSLTLIAILLWAFCDVAKMAKAGVDRPLQRLSATIVDQQKLVLLPAMIFPIFIGAYTWAKCSIPFVVGYPWERYWADVDVALLGSDGWRILHAVFPDSYASGWTFFYAVVWGLALGICGSLISAFAGHRFTATFFTSMMLSWLIGGLGLAYLISAAGPVFAHLADPSLAERFAPLRQHLLATLGPDDIVMTSQRYLAAGMHSKLALKGGGVSAMPSMHIATATIFVLAAGRSWWLVPAAAFWVLTFFGSIYLGYHYAIDAPVAALVATCCWFAARWIYRPKQASMDYGRSAAPLAAKR